VSCDFRGVDWNATVNTPRPGTDSGDRNTQVAVDGAGKGFLIWEQSLPGEGVSSVFTERYDGSWVAASVGPLESYTTNDAYVPGIALDEAGAGTAIWLQRTASGPELWARRYESGVWHDPETIASGAAIEFDPAPAIAIDPMGTSVAIWSQSLPTLYNVRAARHVAGASIWEAPQSLETDDQLGDLMSDYSGPRVGMDGDGNAIATWRKKNASGRILISTSRLSATANTWTPVNGMLLHDDGTHTALVSDLAVSRNGTAIATWGYGTDLDIWASVYR